ncbi:MAG TPA: histidine kinase dimerization/phospho-acceptor domain-containing protein, partial [Bryobacteraceae bacterium]|nr:histidine kinase dimerization/phospho-acceptor domain-containing protein [Bryobacteraceae bacterium]
MKVKRHLLRGLRFTLTAIYTGLFTLVLLGVGILFRQNLASNLDAQVHDDLNQTWAVLKGYLRIENDPGETNYHPKWFFDLDDADEASASARVKAVYFIGDPNGKPVELSKAWEGLGNDTPAQIKRVLASNQAQWREVRDAEGVPYLLRASYIVSEDNRQRYYVAIGASLAESERLVNRFTLLCVGLIPFVMLTGFGTGWVFAGRALTPVLEIARTAQRISGSNLSLRIPSRGTGDELDYLIETFNQMIERVEANFNQVRQFSTDVSHELRTPITIVRGQLEVALMTARNEEELREAMVDSLADIERLSQIVRALLLLSQAETGQVVLQKQRLDLVHFTEALVDQFQIPAEGADVYLRFVSHCASCEGDFDQIQLERMLSNLLSNAIKFTPAGGKITVSLARVGDL